MNVYREPPYPLPSSVDLDLAARVRSMAYPTIGPAYFSEELYSLELSRLLDDPEQLARARCFEHSPPPFIPHEGKPLYHRPMPTVTPRSPRPVRWIRE